MAVTPTRTSHERRPTPARGTPATGLVIVAALVVLAAVLRPFLVELLVKPAVASWSTLFLAITIQAVPFLILGVTVSGAIAAFVPPGRIAALLPRRRLLAVPAAATAGAALPGCECGSVPIASRLVAAGVTPAAALAFLLSAPAINPIVLASTAVAFPGQPMMVLARFVASLAAAVAVGLVWTALGRDDLLATRRRWEPAPGPKVQMFLATARHDFLQAGGYLVVGAAAAATLQTLVPRSVVDAFADNIALSVLALGLLAVLLALCSEADAFVAAGLKQFPLTARLVFLVVGPMVDVKLIALQAGTFGPRFAAVFAPLTFVVAVACAVLTGWWLL